MRPTNIILLASQNEGKVAEYRHLFENDYPDLELRALGDQIFNPSRMRDAENGKTYFDNAFAKGKLVFLGSKYPTISDDTGLEVDALGGRPGVFSDRYATVAPGESKAAANQRKLLEELKGVPKEKRTARFVATVLLMMEGLVLSATESLEGSILEIPRGARGFGYDPVFLVKGTDKSLAEMTLEEKNKLSHRAKALQSLMRQLRDKGIHLVRS